MSLLSVFLFYGDHIIVHTSMAVRAAKEAAKLAGAALKKSRKTVEDFRNITIGPGRHFRNLAMGLRLPQMLSNKRHSKIHPESGATTPMEKSEPGIPSAPATQKDAIALLSEHGKKAFF
eukprot:scaffold61211_cov27-Prasinocladus_malaysianus.AAC.1